MFVLGFILLLHISNFLNIKVLLFVLGFWCSRICNLSFWEIIRKESCICSSSTSSPSHTVVDISRAEVMWKGFTIMIHVISIYGYIGKLFHFLQFFVKTSVADLSCSVSSADSKCREESAKLLGCLIRNCERLILPYIAPIHKVEYLYSVLIV